MKKQVIIFAIVIFLVSAGATLVLYDPFNTEKSRFVGTWNSDDNFFVLNFNRDGTGVFYGILMPYNGSGTWQIDNGNITLRTWHGEQKLLTQARYPYHFSNDDKTLQIAGIILRKQ
jgi:hypothetical protein